jgi:CBS domain-containing protein
MVTDRDIICRGVGNGRDVNKLTARDVMTEGIVYCRDRDSIDEALGIMESKKVRRLPVIDDSKRLVGMLCFGDISHAAPPKLAGELMAAVSSHHD